MTEQAPLLPKPTQADPQQSSLRLLGVALSVFALIFLVSINTSIGSVLSSHCFPYLVNAYLTSSLQKKKHHSCIHRTTIGPSIAADFDAFEHTSWISSCFMIASSCATPLAGRLSAVFTSRIVSFAASLFLAAGACVAALSPNFPVFLVGRVLMGLGGGSLLSSAIVVVLDLASVKRRGMLLGIVNSAFTAGLSLGGVLGAHASSTYGWVSTSSLLQLSTSMLNVCHVLAACSLFDSSAGHFGRIFRFAAGVEVHACRNGRHPRPAREARCSGLLWLIDFGTPLQVECW